MRWLDRARGIRSTVVSRLGGLHETLTRFTLSQAFISRFNAGPDARCTPLCEPTIKPSCNKTTMKRLILATCIALSGCAGNPPPAVEVRTVTRTVETMRPCAVTPPVRPAKLARPLPSDPVALAAAVTLKLMEYDSPGGFADKALAAIGQCTKP